MPSAGADDLAAAVEAVWQGSRGEIAARAERLEEAVGALLGGTLDQSRRADAERDAHKLAGSLGMFGLTHGSLIAGELERSLAIEGGPSAADGARLSELVLELQTEIDGRQTARAPAAQTPDERPLALIVDDDQVLAKRLEGEGAAQGLRTKRAASPREARRLLEHERPDVVLLDLGFPAGSGDPLALLSELARAEPPVPVLVLAVSDALLDRVEAARAGACGFLTKALRPARIVDALRAELERASLPEATLLAVDDDPAVLSALGALLGPHGIDVKAVSDPLRFWEALEESAPDLVVFDVDMPGINGIELCRTLRADARFSELPALFLTGHTDPPTVNGIFESGADDYVAKPIVGPELVMRIRNRLERIRLLRRLADTDTLTGVATRRASEESFERYMRMAERFAQPFSLALVDLDHFKRVNDLAGHAAGDAVLRRLADVLQQNFRSEDVVARWGGEEFVVGMYGMSREDGVQRVADALETFRGETLSCDDGTTLRPTFSAGVSEYQRDGADLHALYRAADAALYEAKAAGRDRVAPAGWRASEAAPQIDVALVEDDEAVAGLLLHALETRGLEARWIADGEEACRIFGGDESALPRVLLLDVDLPGVDGLSLLRRLAGAGALSRTRVIMLTARAAETEVVEALELGAFDHVAKPFSGPILMQRIRRALRA